jgi:membrane peptidoglycan carboxypeptidase
VYAREVAIRAPHFVFYVLAQLRAQYGDTAVETGGLTVRTTLDYNKQTTAQDLVTNRVAALQSHHVTNGALISLDPTNGDILAMVGSIGYGTPGFGSVNVTTSNRQPGSSFKPLAYVTAFKKGWNGATIVDDAPLRIPQTDGTVYEPKNYDLQWHGRLTLRKALDNSLNIPAIKVIQYASIHDTIATAKDLGITSLNDESRFGVSLVLGSGEVSPLQMAGAYGTFANQGNYVPPRAIIEIKDRYDNITYTAPNPTSTNALDSRLAYMITNILADDSSRQPEFPAGGPLKLSRPAAAKTGTTNDFRDNWTVGYTPQLVTAVWVGNNDNSAMTGVDGITGAAPIWHDYMEAALASEPVKNFELPAGLTIASICPDGSLAEGFNTGITEVFLNEALPTTRCHAQKSEDKTEDPGQTDPGPISFLTRGRGRLNRLQ